MSTLNSLAAALLAGAALFALPTAAIAQTDAASAAADAALQERLRAMRIGALRAVTVHEAPQEGPGADAVFLNVDGAEVAIADFQGQVVFVNLWATWCPPCIAEMPYIDGLAAAFADRPFAVVAVNSADRDAAGAAAWFAENGYDHLAGYAAGLDFGRAIGALGLPTSIVLDAQGREVARLAGEAEWNSAEAIAFFEILVSATEAALETPEG